MGPCIAGKIIAGEFQAVGREGIGSEGENAAQRRHEETFQQNPFHNILSPFSAEIPVEPGPATSTGLPGGRLPSGRRAPPGSHWAESE
jgi:hypothetical protein